MDLGLIWISAWQHVLRLDLLICDHVKQMPPGLDCRHIGLAVSLSFLFPVSVRRCLDTLQGWRQSQFYVPMNVYGPTTRVVLISARRRRA